MDKQLAIHGGPRTIPQGFIQPSPPTTTLDEEYVLKSLRGSRHAWGENCDLLQTEFAKWNGNKHCIATTSGTAALHMALVAVGCAAGDEVITPAYSWTSSASCILHAGCIPVFVDVDPLYINLDPAKIEAAITKRTRAILVVHLHGVPADLRPILAIAKKHKLKVIEDCCQAHGALYRGRKVGTIAHIAAFSLNQNKMMSAGEGGLLVTDSKDLIERARSLVLFGDFRDPLPDRNYRHYGTGYMYRYNDLCAAYARAQLTRLDESITHSRKLFAILRRGLHDVRGLILPQEPPWGAENAYNFVCHVDPDGVGYHGPSNYLREAVVAALQAEGVPASVWQRRILPEMSAIAARNAFGNGSPWREHRSKVKYSPAQFPVALRHSDTYFIIGGLRLPNTTELADRVVAGIRKVFGQLDTLDIKALAKKADVGFYERGWQKHAAKIAAAQH